MPAGVGGLHKGMSWEKAREDLCNPLEIGGEEEGKASEVDLPEMAVTRVLDLEERRKR